MSGDVQTRTPVSGERSMTSEAASENAPIVRVEGLVKNFQRRDGTIVKAINDISFDVHAGEMVVLLGPSGCGKTTLLRCIAGLEQPDGGRVEVQGQTVYSSDQGINIRAERRKLSMVFQSYALWPHMTVQENIAYPLKSMPSGKRPSSAEISDRVSDIMRKVGIAGLEKQYPNAISGGQQQRVALSRALIAGRSLVLFDEPLSNVDAQVREQLRVELLMMQREFQFAALFVTHDRDEAMVLGNRIAVLNGGQVRQLETPDRIYQHPEDRFVARFIGPINEVPVRSIVSGQDPTDAFAETSLGTIHGRTPHAGVATDDMVAVWRPECTVLTTEEPVTENRWKCTVEHALYYGSQTEYVVTVDGHSMRVLGNGQDIMKSGPAWLSVKPKHVSFVPNDV